MTQINPNSNSLYHSDGRISESLNQSRREGIERKHRLRYGARFFGDGERRSIVLYPAKIVLR